MQEWLLYRSDSIGTGVPVKEQVALCDFKLQIAECLSIQTERKGSKKQGRTSVELEVKKRRGSALPLLAKAIRMDANDYWPTMYLTISGDADFQDVKDVVMSSALNAALQI